MNTVTRKKFFTDCRKEKKWLEDMNKLGYELVSATLGRYKFNKTDRKIIYDYVFLKSGRKSFKEFDYKSKDARCKAVYANADRALFKRLESAGDFTLFSSRDEKILNAERKKTQLNSHALLNMGLVLIFTALSKVITPLSWLMYLCVIACAILAIIDYSQTYHMSKYISEIKQS